MTDVANAVLDAADAIMLCSETATGMFPVECLTTAVRICRNAEAAINYNIQHSFIRDFSAKPFNTVTAASVALAKGAMDAQLQAAVVVSNSGEAADVVTKYRPDVPVIVATSEESVVLQCKLKFGQYGMLVSRGDINSADAIVEMAKTWVRDQGLVSGDSARIAIMHGYETADVRSSAVIRIVAV